MDNVASKFRVFQLLLYKNFLVRKKQWKLILFVEFLVPLLLFMLIQSGRDLSSEPPKKIDYDTYDELIPVMQKGQLNSDLPVGFGIKFYYSPNSAFMSSLMEKVRSCLRVTYGSKFDFLKFLI